MKHNPAFKQFAKDCPKHLSEETLKNGSLRLDESNSLIHLKEKYTKTTKIRNKF